MSLEAGCQQLKDSFGNKSKVSRPFYLSYQRLPWHTSSFYAFFWKPTSFLVNYFPFLLPLTTVLFIWTLVSIKDLIHHSFFSKLFLLTFFLLYYLINPYITLIAMNFREAFLFPMDGWTFNLLKSLMHLIKWERGLLCSIFLAKELDFEMKDCHQSYFKNKNVSSEITLFTS